MINNAALPGIPGQVRSDEQYFCSAEADCKSLTGQSINAMDAA